MNVLKTLKRLAAATKRFLGNRSFRKISKIFLQITTEQIWGKTLKIREAYLEKHIFDKAANIVTPLQLHCKYCLIGLCTF